MYYYLLFSTGLGGDPGIAVSSVCRLHIINMYLCTIVLLPVYVSLIAILTSDPKQRSGLFKMQTMISNTPFFTLFLDCLRDNFILNGIK